MSLDFLSPDPATPIRSPLVDAALASGATTEIRDGWEVVASFGDAGAESSACAESVGFADLSQLSKLELQRSADSSDGGFASGRALRIDGGWRCPVRPTLELIVSDTAPTDATLDSLRSSGWRLCDLTGSLAAIAIAGPAARETFARFCALDLRESSLPVHGFRPGSVARTPGYVLREGPDRFLMLFGASYAAYVWEVVADAAVHLGGRPVGVAALPAISEEPSNA